VTPLTAASCRHKGFDDFSLSFVSLSKTTYLESTTPKKAKNYLSIYLSIYFSFYTKLTFPSFTGMPAYVPLA
jgi:hypothetical protein